MRQAEGTGAMPGPVTTGTPFDTDFDPVHGVAETVVPGIRRIVAPNPSAMTFTGTNTYLVGRDELAVIDPGPDDGAHLQAILQAARGARISHVIVTHSHVDHSPLARKLAAQTGAPVLALGDSSELRSPRMAALAAGGRLEGGEGVDHAFAPDRRLVHGEEIAGAGWRLKVLATPGHFSNHACLVEAQSGAVFSGDHVMGWATTLVSPPDGDVGDFMRSLQLMLAETPDHLYLPGHGKPVARPHALVRWLIAHRKEREAQILTALATGPATATGLAERIYTEIPPALLPAAARNVFAHLLDLADRNLAAPVGEPAFDSPFAPV